MRTHGETPIALSRRQFLAGAAMGLSALAGCGTSGGRPKAAAPAAGTRPFPNQPEGTESLPQIQHIVVLMMENHSFDNFFGALGRGAGLTFDVAGRPANHNPDAHGRPVHAFRMPTTCQMQSQPESDWFAAHVSWNGGHNDGFVRSPSGPVSMGYFTAAQLPFYHGLANAFPLCDRWFASALAGTFVNRRYLLAATSAGAVRQITDPQQLNRLPAGGTIVDSLNRHGISWRDYYGSEPQLNVFRPLLQAQGANTAPTHQFFLDAASGQLPAVSFIDPDFEHFSGEAPQDVLRSEAFSARVVNAITKSPAWKSTVLIWCHDEGGGYYDHVPPPRAADPDTIRPALAKGDPHGDFDRYGFRVPAVIVSPWSRPNYVSHVVHDHTSVLKLIETKWNLPSLTRRDAAASNLLDCLDLSSPAFLTPPALPASSGDEDNASCTTMTPSQLPPFPN
jgi:phospholipase C